MELNRNLPSFPSGVSNTWSKPPVSFLKCNVDARVFEMHGKVGSGMVIYNHMGDFIVARTC